MAETTTKSGNIYSMSSHTLDRISKIAEADKALFDEDRVRLGDIGETFSEQATNVVKAKQFTDDINSINERAGSMLTTEDHDALRIQLEDMKNKNLEGILSGDKGTQQTQRNALNTVQTDIMGWQEMGKNLPEIQKTGWSMSMSEDERHVIGQMAAGKGRMKLGEGGKVTFEVTMPDGNTIELDRTAFDNIVTENVKPSEFINNRAKFSQSVENSGYEGGAFDQEERLNSNLETIQGPNAPRLSSLMKDKNIIYGTNKSVVDMLPESPWLQSLNIPVDEDNAYDENGDGVLTIDDFQGEDINNLVDLLEQPENQDLAYQVIAEMMTLNDKGNWQKGKDRKAAEEEKAGIESNEPVVEEGDTSGQTTEAADLINEALGGNTTQTDTTLPDAVSPDDTFISEGTIATEGGGEIKATTQPIKPTFDEGLKKLEGTVYEGDDITQLQRQFERQARSNGMSQVDIDKLFRYGGPAIITKLPNGKYTVRLRTDADANLPRQRPTGEPVE